MLGKWDKATSGRLEDPEVSLVRLLWILIGPTSIGHP